MDEAFSFEDVCRPPRFVARDGTRFPIALFSLFVYSKNNMVVRMRHTKSHSANRRSHHALTGPRLSLCINCGAPHLRHRMCANCGTYRKREVVNVVAIAEKKATRAKAKARSLGQEPDATKAKEARKEHKH